LTADSLRAWCERVRLRADSTFQPLDDDVFARRLAGPNGLPRKSRSPGLSSTGSISWS
jgi:hypothetical protein